MGERLLAQEKIMVNGSVECHKNKTGIIYEMYCGTPNITADDPDCQYLLNNEVGLKPGIPGLSSGVFLRKFIKDLVYPFELTPNWPTVISLGIPVCHNTVY